MRSLLDTPTLTASAPALTHNAPRLSKTRLVNALQCDRKLWLSVHRPDLVVIDPSTQAVFDAGHRVGEVARQVAVEVWGQGELIDVKEPLGWSGGLERCRLLLEQARRDRTQAVLFEAPFSGPDFAVIADIVVQHADGELWLIEVKSSTKLDGKPYFDDATFQAHVMAGCGFPTDRVFVRLIDTSFVYPGGGEYGGLFRDEDVTEEVNKRLVFVDAFVARSRVIAAGDEPAIRVGAHCSIPYDCPFRTYCDEWQAAIDGPETEYPISVLSKRGVGRLSASERRRIEQSDWTDVREIPDDFLADPRTRTVARAIREGRPWIAPALREVLFSLPYPRYYFDFESINPAVPFWPGTRPYQQVPFQWSCHVEQSDGRLHHHQFLNLSGTDPRRACAEQLVQLMAGPRGCVLVYFQAFEESRLRELSRDLPDLAEALNRVILKLRDLLPIVREHYYHPALLGSYSIKAVLPTVVPELDYSGLKEVQDGGGAQRAYLEAIDPGTTVARKSELEQRMMAYCERDTFAMVELVSRLRR